jgi:hypothetical protein
MGAECIRPPVLQITIFIIEPALVIKSMSNLMTDHNSDAFIVNSIIAGREIKRRL